ncbi:MAG: cell division protein FtsA [Candidatus Eremiobacteraeota bacterium]|nr:cell division protein FtsA [Candidatus Eremiobacteraeota bacterium]MBV8432688.1 cell division protein FtsA [Candidatus Eremiobacteraeota bacterium]
MKPETVCGLDIGTTKTCAVVAVDGPNGLEIVGVGEAPSLGMRKGVVVDLDETIKSIEAATEKAERMAGMHVADVFVGITGDHIRSTNNRAVVAVSGEDREVSSTDVRRVVDASKIINLPADRQIIHALPRYFTVDGQEGVDDPVGMAGGRLEVDTHIITGGSSFITNVLKCVHRAGLEAAGLVVEPLASSTATLMPEEKQVGVVLLDIGGGTTDIAVYSLGSAIYTATIPVGGNILTNDISLGLKTTLAEAEEVKKRLGAGIPNDVTEEAFAVRTLDGRSTKEHTASQLRAIVVPRVLETLRMAKQKIVDNVPRDLVLGEVVLTGGGALLPGIGPIAEDVFGLPVRVGAPNTIGGLTDAMAQPQYATAIGLVMFGAGDDGAETNGRRRRNGSVLGWIKKSLADLWN